MGGGIIIVASVIAWVVWLAASPPGSSSSSARMSYVPTGAPSIDVSEPRGTTLDDPPTRFAWEAVSGRFQYITLVFVKGASQPVHERAKILPGKTYVWTVVAQGKDGSSIGADQSSFKVR